MAPVLIRSPAGIPPGRCSMIDPDSTITENYGVLVSRTLVDTSNWSAEITVAVTVARTLSNRPEATLLGPLPPHLAEIVTGSHSSLGADGRVALMDNLHKYSHVFPAPGDPATDRTQVVHHKIETNGARPARCGPRHLTLAGLRPEQ